VLSLGLEIRVKVSQFVMDRIKALRLHEPGHLQNVACLRTNAMKYLPNFFHKGQVLSNKIMKNIIFILFQYSAEENVLPFS